MKRIYQILKRHFPKNVRWYNQLTWDNDMEYLSEKFCKTDAKNATRLQLQSTFYEVAPKLFQEVTEKESLLERRKELVREMLAKQLDC